VVKRFWDEVSICRKEEASALFAMGLALLATIVFMLGGGPKSETRGIPAESTEKDVLWLRNYLTNLQSGAVNEMAVDSLRESKETIIPVLVQEMSVRPPTIGKRLNDRVEKVMSRFPCLQRSPPVPDAYRAAAAWALVMIFRGPQEEGYRPATTNEAKLLLPVLASAIYDNAAMVRAHAADALGAFGVEGEDALALCEVAFADSDWMVRASAVNSAAALSRIEPDAMKMLKHGLEDRHPEVRRRAREILVRAGIQAPAAEEATAVATNYFE
jgi:hypothetical protein